MFTQPCIEAQIKENIKAPHHWPLWGEFTSDRWIPCTRASNVENVSIWWRHHTFFIYGWAWSKPTREDVTFSHRLRPCSSMDMINSLSHIQVWGPLPSADQSWHHDNFHAVTLHLVAYNSWHDDNLCLGDSHRKADRQPGPRLNIKTVLSTYGDFHVKDKTAVRTSYL